MTDPFVNKFYSPLQNNMGPNFGDGLNFVTCGYSRLRKDVVTIIYALVRSNT